MRILKFIWLALRPIGKVEATYGWWELMNLMPPSVYFIVPYITQWTRNFDFIWFVSLPAILLLIAGLKLQFRLSKIEQISPKITVEPTEYPNNTALLQIYNEGTSAEFHATARIMQGGIEKLYAMVWRENQRAGARIDKRGYGQILVAKISDETIDDEENLYETIFRGGLVLYEIYRDNVKEFGASSHEEVPSQRLNQIYPTMRIEMRNKCTIEVEITSEPSPPTAFRKYRYSLEVTYDNGPKLMISSVSNLDKEDSQNQ